MKNSGFFLILLLTICIVTIRVMGQDSTVLTNQTTKLPEVLRFAVPVRSEFNEFVKVIYSSDGTNNKNFTGFSIEVFKEAAQIIGPSFKYVFVSYPTAGGNLKASFNEMLQDVQNKEKNLHGAVGDITILSQRVSWVDFTTPYLDTEIRILLPLRVEREALKPVTTIVLVVVVTLGFGILVAVMFWIWKLCKYNNASSLTQTSGIRDTYWKRTILGSIMYTRVVIILVLMVLLVIIACYVPLQTSLISTQPLVSDIKDLNDLIRKGSIVGYRQGAFMNDTLVYKQIPESQLKELGGQDEMYLKLQKGGKKGGVDAVVAGIQHLKIFQDKYCNEFTLAPHFRLPSAGLGFAFQKDLPSESGTLVDQFSEAIVQLIDNGRIDAIRATTIGDLDDVCEDKTRRFQERLSLWFPIASVIFVVVLVIAMLISYIGTLMCMKK